MSTLPALVVLAALAVVGAVAYRVYRRRRARRERKASGAYWSIAYQRSTHPLRWDPARAKVYSRQSIAEWVRTLADPFLIRRDNEIFLFCEVAVRSSVHAKIGVSVYDEDRDEWEFKSIVLDEPFHLSYPHVFSDGGEYYMVPESKQARSIRLYRATEFPQRWQLEKVLVPDTKLVDPTLVVHGGRYYLFASRKRRLYLYHADSLRGTWQRHPQSPVKRWNRARCAGRIIEHEGSLYRFAQEQAKGYGSGVHVFEILQLSARQYRETPVSADPLLRPFGTDWASRGMHHIDVLALGQGQYLGVFDGQGVVGPPPGRTACGTG